MYSVYRCCGSSIKRSTRMGLWYIKHTVSKPCMLQKLQYSGSKGGDDDKKPTDEIPKIIEDDKLASRFQPKESEKEMEKLEAAVKELKDIDPKNKDKAQLEKDLKDINLAMKDKLPPLATPKFELRIVPAQYSDQGYEERNLQLGRELSPHLSIYKIQLTSAMSIMLRISGFVIAMGVWVIGLSGLVFDFNIDELAKQIEKCDCNKKIFGVLKFFIVLPLAYHAVAGTRHLIWYLNVFLSKPEIYTTGYVALALAFILAVGLSVIKPGEENEEKSSKDKSSKDKSSKDKSSKNKSSKDKPKDVSYDANSTVKVQNLLNENQSTPLTANDESNDEQMENVLPPNAD